MIGDIVLAETKGEWIANEIKWFTGSRWSHSFVTLPSQLDQEMCIEAASNGISEVGFDLGYKNNLSQSYRRYSVNVSEEVKDKALKACMLKLEDAYAFLAYPWFMWRSLNKLFGRDIKHKDNWYTKHMVCSGLCRMYLEECGLGDLFSAFGKGSMHVQDMEDVFKAHPEMFSVVEEVRL